jgi:hypothetical protein
VEKNAAPRIKTARTSRKKAICPGASASSSTLVLLNDIPQKKVVKKIAQMAGTRGLTGMRIVSF